MKMPPRAQSLASLPLIQNAGTGRRSFPIEGMVELFTGELLNFGGVFIDLINIMSLCFFPFPPVCDNSSVSSNQTFDLTISKQTDQWNYGMTYVAGHFLMLSNCLDSFLSGQLVFLP